MKPVHWEPNICESGQQCLHGASPYFTYVSSQDKFYAVSHTLPASCSAYFQEQEAGISLSAIRSVFQDCTDSVLCLWVWNFGRAFIIPQSGTLVIRSCLIYRTAVTHPEKSLCLQRFFNACHQISSALLQKSAGVLDWWSSLIDASRRSILWYFMNLCDDLIEMLASDNIPAPCFHIL